MNWSAGFLNIEPHVVQGMQINIATSASITKTNDLHHRSFFFSLSFSLFSNFIPSDAKKAIKHIKLHTVNVRDWFWDASTACFLSGLAVPCCARVLQNPSHSCVCLAVSVSTWSNLGSFLVHLIDHTIRSILTTPRLSWLHTVRQNVSSLGVANRNQGRIHFQLRPNTVSFLLFCSFLFCFLFFCCCSFFPQICHTQQSVVSWMKSPEIPPARF